MEDNDEDDDDAQPYLINKTLIDMIRATAQDESIKLVEPEVDEEVGEDWRALYARRWEVEGPLLDGGARAPRRAAAYW